MRVVQGQVQLSSSYHDLSHLPISDSFCSLPRQMPQEARRATTLDECEEDEEQEEQQEQQEREGKKMEQEEEERERLKRRTLCSSAEWFGLRSSCTVSTLTFQLVSSHKSHPSPSLARPQLDGRRAEEERKDGRRRGRGWQELDEDRSRWQRREETGPALHSRLSSSAPSSADKSLSWAISSAESHEPERSPASRDVGCCEPAGAPAGCRAPEATGCPSHPPARRSRPQTVRWRVTVRSLALSSFRVRRGVRKNSGKDLVEK
eukprot:755831-Hanusia_phi.AAC.1